MVFKRPEFGPKGGFLARRWIAFFTAVVMLALGFWLLANHLIDQQFEAFKPALEEARAVPVNVAIAEEGPLTGAVIASGPMTPVREALLAATVEGLLFAREVKPGDQVAKGEILARLNATPFKKALSEARAEVAVAQANFKSALNQIAQARLELQQARADLIRFHRLLKEKVVSQEELDKKSLSLEVARRVLAQREGEANEVRAQLGSRAATLKQAASDLTATMIRSPIDGIVLEIFHEVGKVVTPGTPIVRVGDLTSIEIATLVSEEDLPRVRLGEQVRVRVEDLPRMSLVGRVSFISTQMEPSSRQVPVIVTVQNQVERMTTNLMAEVELAEPSESHVIVSERALSLMQSAADQDDRGTVSGTTRADSPDEGVVFVPTRDASGAVTVSPRRVRIGRRADGRVEILSGLRAGERVVEQSAQPLSDGARVIPR